MKKLLVLLLAVGFLAAKDDADTKRPKPRFPLGKETTYVTEPLDDEGYIDYAAALNERLRRGVTPENNANVLIWKAIGPRPEGVTIPDGFFKSLGIKPPPERGDYFISMLRFLREQRKLDPVPDAKTISEELSHCAQQPWNAAEHAKIAAWLKANEEPLALVMKASQRTHYYSPLIPKKTDKGSSGLIGALIPGVQKCRELANVFTTRAMLHIGEGRFEDARQDLLACHRLGRLVGCGPTKIDLLVGIAIDAIAAKADVAFLERVDWKAEQINSHLRELQKLPPMPLAADKVDFGERFVFLDSIEIFDRYGPEGFEAAAGAAPAEAQNSIANFFSRTAINWEPALRNGNRWFDRIAKAMRAKDREEREKQLKQIGEELDELNKKSANSSPGIFQLRKAKGEQIANIFIGLLAPALHKVQQAGDRCAQVQNNLYLAFALAAYRREHGRYPKQLEALAPKYLDKIPMDLFSSKPLVYRPSEDGYLLYSVGVNGQDEQGRSFDDQPQGDDLTIHMPLPKLKHK